MIHPDLSMSGSSLRFSSESQSRCNHLSEDRVDLPAQVKIIFANVDVAVAVAWDRPRTPDPSDQLVNEGITRRRARQWRLNTAVVEEPELLRIVEDLSDDPPRGEHQDRGVRSRFCERLSAREEGVIPGYEQ